jgi:copper chaperone CopZ
MKLPVSAVLVLAAVLIVSCRKQDMRTVTIGVAGMKNNACAAIVVDALQKSQNLQPEWIKADVEKRTVTVTYDSLQRSLRNLEFAIADAGFTANHTPANRQAAESLPADCR